jgi:hypothetical protein
MNANVRDTLDTKSMTCYARVASEWVPEMAILTHEVWEDSAGLPSCCLSGPMGDEARKLLDSGAKLVRTFEAGSHFEAMTTYNAILNRGPYATDQEWDRQPYPDDWVSTQAGGR